VAVGVGAARVDVGVGALVGPVVPVGVAVADTCVAGGDIDVTDAVAWGVLVLVAGTGVSVSVGATAAALVAEGHKEIRSRKRSRVTVPPQARVQVHRTISTTALVDHRPFAVRPIAAPF
jgi:hypothetical protein